MSILYTNDVVATLIDNKAVKAVKAVKYVSPKLIVRGTRKLYGKKIISNSNIEITLTIGRPNFLEREFIKLCQKAKEPFPIKKIQLKLYNPKPNKLHGKRS